MSKFAAILIGTGAVVLVAGVLWKTAVFPGYERIPDDFSRIDEFTGYYTVVDPIAIQARDNEAVRALRNDPVAMGLLAEPRVNEILTGSRPRDALADEAVLDLLADQATLVQAVRSPQNLRGVVPDGFLQLLADPEVQSLLTNPRVMSVVTDPEALALVMDARVQALMADPTRLSMSTIPVIVHRERHATGSDGDTVRIRETVATTVADGSGNAMPGFPETDVALALNARTREYLPETEDGRTGALSFPFNVDA
jgi:hypothetical protein